MPRRISAAALTALQTNEIITRDFIYINVKEWDTDISRVFYYWSGIDNISAKITNPLDKTIQTHVFEGAGQLLEIEDISGGSGIVVRTLQISLAAVDDAHTLMRTYNAKLAPVIIWRGLMNAGGETLVTPAIPRFTGYVDQVEIIEGKDGVPSGISATCVSEMITLLKTFPFTRSDQYQRERSASDSFRMHAATIGNRELFWGSVKGKLPAEEESTESTGAKSEDVQTFTSGGGGDGTGAYGGPSTASTGASKGGAQGRGTDRGPSTASTGASKGGAQGRGTDRGPSTASTGNRGRDIDADEAENKARSMRQMDEQAVENEGQDRGDEDIDANAAENKARARQQMDEQARENERIAAERKQVRYRQNKEREERVKVKREEAAQEARDRIATEREERVRFEREVAAQKARDRQAAERNEQVRVEREEAAQKARDRQAAERNEQVRVEREEAAQKARDRQATEKSNKGGAQGRGTERGPSTASTGTSKGGAQGRGTERGPSTASTGTSKGGAQGRGTERGPSTASTGGGKGSGSSGGKGSSGSGSGASRGGDAGDGTRGGGNGGSSGGGSSGGEGPGGDGGAHGRR